jgi:Alpha-L-fucosidase
MKSFLSFACVTAALASLSPAQTISPSRAVPESSAANEERVQWFRDAKFGLFIHWGLYAIPAGYWDGKPVASIGEWIMKRATIPVGEYEKLASDFNPVKFDADAWAQLAQDAGMKYVVLTAKHHDGFALFHSDVSNFNIRDATPFGRDIVKELAEACARRGLRFGVYYSQSQDWHEPGGAGNDWDFPSDAEKDTNGAFDHYLRTKAEPQVRELLTNYGSLALIWFDTALMMEKGDRADRFTQLVRELQPDCLINGRLGKPGDYISTGDNQIPNEDLGKPWEVPATLNHTWGYRKDDHNWKPASDLAYKLVDIVSKGGNYLLNVGPDATGVIPEPSQTNLRTVGEWLQRNGEAIYGAQPSPFGEEFGEPARQLRNFRGEPVFLSHRAWRCTTKPGKLYITIFELERAKGHGNFAFPDFKNEIRSVRLLGDPDHPPFPVVVTEDGRRGFHPRTLKADRLGDVYVVEFEGDVIER